ncbi:hypothetical protein IT570_07090 [Candidatus Sumerlaeota bacterium]|nr:hypothetical protein [Candidatus Sumerlaeota bacterium]
MGERMRANAYRPCLSVLTAPALTGALKARFPHPTRPIFAGGYLLDEPDTNVLRLFTYSPRDRAGGSSVLPISTEFLECVRARIFVRRNDFTSTWPAEFRLSLGAHKTKGFGACRLTLERSEPQHEMPVAGRLDFRLPDNDAWRQAFGIREVHHPVFGYLFKPERGGTGHYVRGLFEGTRVVGDPILFKENSPQ